MRLRLLIAASLLSVGCEAPGGPAAAHEAAADAGRSRSARCRAPARAARSKAGR
jgi:hypothetical protein